MFRFFISLVCVALVAVSCLKNQDASCPYTNTSINAPISEQDTIEAYLDSNNIDAILHPSGFYYQVINAGTGTDSVGLCSQIVVNYSGKVKGQDTTFDRGTNAYFVLGSLIEGWKKGIPLVKRGGEIRLFIPPSLGYGNTDVKDDNQKVVIPARSTLIFDVKLQDHN